MKKLIAIIACMCCCVNIMAQKIKHPTLLFTESEIQSAKQRLKSDTSYVRNWNEIKRIADERIKGNSINHIDYLSLAYLMTGQEKYADKVSEILINAVKAKSWGNSEMLARNPAWNSELQMAHKAYRCAIAYDAIYNTLSPSERRTIADGLNRLAVQPLLKDWIMEPTRIHSLNSMGHNWWTSCLCMGGLLAISLQNEIPEAAEMIEEINEALPQWFDFEGDALQHKPKSFDTNGGMYESLNYANYGIQEALLFILAYKNAYGKNLVTSIPQLSQLPDFFINVCYPRSGMLYNINFGDSHKNATAQTSMILLYALGNTDNNILWYLDKVQENQHGDGFFPTTPMGFLYSPQLDNAPQTPNLPTSSLFPDFGWATMRTSWDKDATMLAVKSGHTWNHSHADANSFILFHKGVDIIKDAGNCSYPNPSYRNYFFQSQAHNVVLFNGKGQSTEQQYHGSPLRGNLYYPLNGANLKYVLADATGPYSDQFSRNFRHFLWIDDIIFIIDDLKTHDYGQFQWLWHPGGTAKKSGYDLTVTNGASSVVIRPLYPRMLANSDFVHDYPEDLYWETIEAPDEGMKEKETYYSFHLPRKFNQIKAVTAITLKDTPDSPDLPTIERRESKDWIGMRVSHNGKKTDIYINQLADGRLMHSNSWITADGWTTDAYMFAVTYADDASPRNAQRLFLLYGSSLRRGEEIHFSSLSKLNFIMDTTPADTKVWINGQTKMTAKLRTGRRPSKLTVNDAPSQYTYKDGIIKIRY